MDFRDSDVYWTLTLWAGCLLLLAAGLMALTGLSFSTSLGLVSLPTVVLVNARQALLVGSARARLNSLLRRGGQTTESQEWAESHRYLDWACLEFEGTSLSRFVRGYFPALSALVLLLTVLLFALLESPLKRFSSFLPWSEQSSPAT
ncbi:MAG: hypothetical protein HYX75_18050 [Acidobacteria bacterium]|nr:hypothetical protein [Acidobacteriota bacterium]